MCAHLCRLSLAARLGPRMAELHLALEQPGARAGDPGHHRLGELAGLERVHQGVLVGAPQLPQHHDNLDLRDVLVAQAVVAQGGPREAVPPDGDACTWQEVIKELQGCRG